MRVVIDTNLLVSGLLWKGTNTPRRLVLKALAGEVKLLISEVLLAGLEDVLSRPKFDKRFIAMNQTRDEVLSIIRRRSQLILVPSVEPVIADDPDDDHVLACAVAGQAEVIVSGDKHLLDLGSYRDIRILTAVALLAELEDTG